MFVYFAERLNPAAEKGLIKKFYTLKRGELNSRKKLVSSWKVLFQGNVSEIMGGNDALLLLFFGFPVHAGTLFKFSIFRYD